MTIGPDRPLFLASASPRRRQLLAQLGIPLRVCPVDVDERVLDGEEPAPYLARVVEAKREAALTRPEAMSCAAIVVADTSVLVDGRILGKPNDLEESRRMLTLLAGREHVVATRYAVTTSGGDINLARTVRTTVWFRELSDADVEAYVATGEGLDKAGAYGIQDVGAFLVERIEGSYSNVVGLPLAQLTESLQQVGLMRELPIITR